jgi:hypothetical protein
MILANHLGESLIPALVVSGAGAGSVLFAVGRARLGRLLDRLRRR